MLGLYLSVLGSADERKDFEELYYRYRSIMFATAFRILRNREKAEDAVHNAFMSATGHIDRLSAWDDDSRCSYLIVSARNAALKIYNNGKREKELGEEETEIPDISDIETDIENRDTQRMVMEKIMLLGEKYSDVFILKYYHGLKDREIALKLGISTENVKIRLVRGKDMLRKMLTEEELYD